jgi:hypothetical protein
MYDIFLCICFRTGALEKRGQLLPKMFNPLLIRSYNKTSYKVICRLMWLHWLSWPLNTLHLWCNGRRAASHLCGRSYPCLIKQITIKLVFELSPSWAPLWLLGLGLLCLTPLQKQYFNYIATVRKYNLYLLLLCYASSIKE